MAVTIGLAADAGGRLGRRMARAAIVALAGVSLLVAAPGDSFGKSRKQQARHSRQAVAHAVRHAVAQRLRAQNLTMAKLVAATAQGDGEAAMPGRAAPPHSALRSAILIDAATGTVLSETRPDLAAYPASLTKMMTLYLTFAALNDGRLRVDQLLPVSPHASGQAPTKLWLRPGDTVPVQALILGLVTRSANDAAVVLGEALAGEETDFAALMTDTAHRLGMSDTIFRNASGLPDPDQHTTARDLARLSLALYQDFPREYAYFSVRAFAFRGQTITTHNHMLESYAGSDGIKTGFIRASGFNLAASAERHGHRLIGVVLGSPSWPTRDREMAAMLDRGFAALGTTPAPGTMPAAIHVADADPVEPAPGQAKSPAKSLAKPHEKPAGLVARLASYAAPVATAHAAPAPKPAPARP
jgi:D-alanyl-D-alanine carboxypeptidase